MSNVSENRISAELSEQAVQEILKKTQEINDLLPFLIGLTDTERKRLTSIGPANLIFLQDVSESVALRPDLPPAYVNTQELAKDVQLWDRLNTVRTPLLELINNINDTLLKVGDEVYKPSLAVYEAIGAASKNGVPGVKAIHEN